MKHLERGLKAILNIQTENEYDGMIWLLRAAARKNITAEVTISLANETNTHKVFVNDVTVAHNLPLNAAKIVRKIFLDILSEEGFEVL